MLIDEVNCDLYDAVRPIKWVDPEVDGQDKYDMLVIGGGAGGLVTAAGSKGLGARVCLIERAFLGGDCLNNGCVPSKAFLRSCNVVHSAKTASKFGVEIQGEIKVDFPAIMKRMKQIRADISDNDSAQRFSKNMGVDLYLGHAKFTGDHNVEINGKVISFTKACVATGGRPNIPDIEGLKDVKYYTSDNIFNLTEQPKKMLIVGAGPIGCELGQGFARLGTNVTIISSGSSFLAQEDADCSIYLQEQMKQDGVQIRLDTNVTSFSQAGEEISATLQHQDQSTVEQFDIVMLGKGRVPNVENLGLDEAGIKFDKTGVLVNDHLQTSNPDVYAVGDCIPGPKFTHNSDVHARYVIRNALFGEACDRNNIILPKCTYTDPEVASIGDNETTLKQKGIEYDTYTKFFDRLDRATCESKRGIYKVHCRKGSDEILGATLVGGPAGDMLSQITQAMTHKLGLQKLGQMIYPYPTFSESFGHMSNYGYMPKYKLGPAGEGALKPGLKQYYHN